MLWREKSHLCPHTVILLVASHLLPLRAPLEPDLSLGLLEQPGGQSIPRIPEGRERCAAALPLTTAFIPC